MELSSGDNADIPGSNTSFICRIMGEIVDAGVVGTFSMLVGTFSMLVGMLTMLEFPE